MIGEGWKLKKLHSNRTRRRYEKGIKQVVVKSDLPPARTKEISKFGIGSVDSLTNCIIQYTLFVIVAHCQSAGPFAVWSFVAFMFVYAKSSKSHRRMKPLGR